MATDIIARGMITEYKSGTNINFAENEDGSVTISASGSISSEDSVARDTINNHKLNKNNPHNVTAEQIGLGNVDNTADLDKPISTAVQQAIDSKADKTVATTSADGLMSAEDKTKLDSVDDTYALKSLYGDTTINVGRQNGSVVGDCSVAVGKDSVASGYASHAEGSNTKTWIGATSTLSDRTVVIDDNTTVIVSGTQAYGRNSHAEGCQSLSYGENSHAEGTSSAIGWGSHSEGGLTKAEGEYSHAEGRDTLASGRDSHAGGTGTKALHTSEVAYGRYNKSNNNTLFSIGDGTADDARHNAFEITTTGGKLHDKDIATTDMSLPANGGNADTLGGKSADDFTQIIGFGNNQTDTKTAIGIPAKTTIYHCSNWTDFPTESPDGQGILIAANYGGSGIAGTDSMWVVQFFISARTGVVYKRYITNTTVYSWFEMYSADNKPYITGSFSGTAASFHFDYAPSFALVNDEGNIKFGDILVISVGGSERGYDVNFSGLSDTTHEYIIFK